MIGSHRCRRAFASLSATRASIASPTHRGLKCGAIRWPKSVSLVEVGPRDGLQNELSTVPTEVKVELIDRLAAAGCKAIEAASFVSPKWVPQMADGDQVLANLGRAPGVKYAALTPNLRGLEAALEAGADEVAVFAAASEAFSSANINCSIVESLERFKPVMEKAKVAGLPVRGYVSCVLGCPYEGRVAPGAVAEVATSLLDMGCYSVSLGDTIGAGTAGSTLVLLETLREAGVPLEKVAVHFHDTYGQALANILVALEEGITVLDTSVSGLGGCPYAPGASGNVATEDVVYMLDGMGINTGVDLDLLLDTSLYISDKLGRPPQSRVARAMLAKRS
ncbi:conserved unknown protein [Ectocarpus siliculosus]|uniref:hydroxymethylglutaryl-CoA lyase n=1 Tax=Ectocarpus siliculosus TaxID=2880 RepID=D8LQ51_ECTSI|nr:conserved unknown protein [Ectocarpus siliculosus]|eukprot:CBN77431.1 conserved unknown protein [Ectocarpus siliculosus]